MNPKQTRIFRRSNDELHTLRFDVYKSVMYDLFEAHNHECIKPLSGFFRSGRFDLALDYADSLSEQSYPDATMHFVANQFAALIRKYPWDPTVVKTDPDSKAISTFFKSERKCSLINRKFRLYGSYRSPHEYRLNEARNFIRYVLGEKPNLISIFNQCDFGSGASIGVHGSATHLAAKLYAKEWTVSTCASRYAIRALAHSHQLVDLLLPSRGIVSCYDVEAFQKAFTERRRYLDYNKITFVPKTARTSRAIAVEPLLNGYLQKGIDQVMRKKLTRIGIDLSDQSKNQRMAREGSLDDSDNGFVTIDLSSASDSISIELCRYLLPPEWFILLNDIRSKNFKHDGKIYSYHKFCSMGNGFCFPLETLLFVACCVACGSGKPGTDFSVYGDDIIVRKKHAGEVLDLLKVMGFTSNVGKTCISGPFRESCGADWFGGMDVRPYTLDHELNSVESMFKWLNLTLRNAMTSAFFSGSRELILSRVPLQFRFIRPFQGSADSGIDSVDYEFLSSPHCRFSKAKQCWTWKELIHSPVADMRFRSGGYRRDSADMYALLRGSLPENYVVVYTFRRKTRTTVKVKSHGGATSMWLPDNP